MFLLEVSFRVLLDASVYDERTLLVRPVAHRPPLTLIRQGERISFAFGLGHELFKGGQPLTPFEVSVRWRSVACRDQLENRYTLDIS